MRGGRRTRQVSEEPLIRADAVVFALLVPMTAVGHWGLEMPTVGHGGAQMRKGWNVAGAGAYEPKQLAGTAVPWWRQVDIVGRNLVSFVA